MITYGTRRYIKSSFSELMGFEWMLLDAYTILLYLWNLCSFSDGRVMNFYPD